MSQNIKIKGKNPYDVLALTLTQKCSAQCEKQVSLFTGGTCFVCCVPGMAWVQLEINQPQVVTAKCSGPQAVDSDVMGEGSGVAILLSVRTETWLG